MFFIRDVDRAQATPFLLIVQDPVGRGIRPIEKVIKYCIEAARLLDK